MVLALYKTWLLYEKLFEDELRSIEVKFIYIPLDCKQIDNYFEVTENWKISGLAFAIDDNGIKHDIKHGFLSKRPIFYAWLTFFKRADDGVWCWPRNISSEQKHGLVSLKQGGGVEVGTFAKIQNLWYSL